uniref:Uncharacterized protein n=1 Tax=Avena sativa TaxID=4498 RepID=A0ACD5V6D7_AVESA
MDSLLATYASSDEDGDEALPSPAPAHVPAPAAAKPSGGIFSALPQPKSAPIFSSLPAPRSGPTFSSIPPPKSSAAASSGNPKRVVQFRPPPIHQPTGASSDEEDDAEKRRPSASVAPPPPSAGSGPVSSFLPAPKHSLGFGSGAARRSAVDTAGPERSNLGSAGPSSSAVNTGAPERPNTGAVDEDGPEESSDEDGEQQQEQQGFDAGAGDQQQQAYDAGVGSANPYDGYTWDQNQNYYADYAGNHGLDPSNNVSYGTEPQYTAYSAEQGAVYCGNEYVGEQSGGYGYSTAPPCGTEYTGAYRSEVAEMAAPPMQEPLMPPEMGRIGGKRGRRDVPMEILEVNQAELMKNRPREDKSKLTGLAFGPSYQAAPSGKAKPSKLAKRKHQIGSLYFDMRAKEMELNERRSKGVLTKAETQAKYGW